MSVAFTDALIALSDPRSVEALKTDPHAFFAQYPLSENERAAILDGALGRIWRHARSVESDDPTQQFNRHSAKPDELLIEVEPSLELHQENNDNWTVFSLGQLMVDENGMLFRVVDDHD